MSHPPSADSPQPTDGLRIEQLTESHRFDAELAELLTQFQYCEDGITLTAAEPRPLSTHTLTPATAGLESVFTAESSLVFVCYDNRDHTMVNPIETELIAALTRAVHHDPSPQPRADGGAQQRLGEGLGEPTPTATHTGTPQGTTHPPTDGGHTAPTDPPPTMGVVTPHNAQRGALDAVLPAGVTANTVEKYQGGERDIIAVSATVSDPRFARQEDRFILNPRRLLVAISRSKQLSIVVCSTALFEVAPRDTERLDDGPIWARLFTQAVGRTPDPAWEGSLGEFVDTPATHAATEYASVPVRVYPSTVTTDGGAR